MTDDYDSGGCKTANSPSQCRRQISTADTLPVFGNSVLGVSGVALLAVALCAAVPIEIWWLNWIPRFTAVAPWIRTLVFVILFAPPVATLSLLGLVLPFRQRSLSLSFLTLICLIAPIIMVTAISYTWIGSRRLFHSPINFGFAVSVGTLVLASVLAIVLVAILVRFFTQSKAVTTLSVAVLVCLLLLLSTPLANLYFSTLTNYGLSSDTLWPIWPIASFTLGAWLLSMALQSSSRWQILTKSEVDSTRQWSILAIMELTFVVAGICASVRMIGLSSAGVGATCAMVGGGVVCSRIAFSCCKALLVPRNERRVLQLAIAFLAFAIVSCALVSFTTSLQFGFAQFGFTLMISMLSGFAASLAFTSTQVVGILWLRRCGWQLQYVP